MDTPADIVAAIFTSMEQAKSCFETLQDQGFEKPWLASTRVAQGEDIADAFGTTAPSKHEIAEASDGPAAAVGRFFNGAGNSLRRALETHGVHADVADRIDDQLIEGGAVLVQTTGSRRELAVNVIETTGGTVVGGLSGAVMGLRQSDDRMMRRGPFTIASTYGVRSIRPWTDRQPTQPPVLRGSASG